MEGCLRDGSQLRLLSGGDVAGEVCTGVCTRRASATSLTRTYRLVEPNQPNRARQEGAYGIRTRATAVRGRRPRPLDECAVKPQGTERVALQPLGDRDQGLTVRASAPLLPRARLKVARTCRVADLDDENRGANRSLDRARVLSGRRGHPGRAGRDAVVPGRELMLCSRSEVGAHARTLGQVGNRRSSPQMGDRPPRQRGIVRLHAHADHRDASRKSHRRRKENGSSTNPQHPARRVRHSPSRVRFRREGMEVVELSL